MKTLLRSASIALLAITVWVPTASAQIDKCERSIAKANSQYLQAIVKAQSKCEGAVVKSGTGSCPDSKADASIAKAEAKLASTIGKSCGGEDKACGGNLNGEFSIGGLGWPAHCPDFENGHVCVDIQINDCSGIASCLACIGAGATDQAMSLYYGDLVPGTQANKTLNKCQVAIGKAASAFLNSKSKALQKCWDARLNGKHGGDCFSPSAGDGKYTAAITKAQDKMEATICKACGGADKVCGGGDDLTVAAIGFDPDCSPVTPPGGAPCPGAVSDLQGIVDCVECVTGFKGDCDDRLAVPQFTPYPPECDTCTLPAPTGPCPTSLSFTADGPHVDLDTGFTGLAHDAQVPTNGRITLAVSGCAGVNQPTCGQCNVAGPFPNDGGVTFNNHRCADAPWVQCTSDPDCTNATSCVGGANNGALCSNASECPGGACVVGVSAGPCVFFFGAPLPLRAGGVSSCVMNVISGPISGTINIDDGSSTTNVPLSSSVFPVGGEFDPCPHCTSGVCVGHGPRIGQACTVNGTGQFGDVSLDCPPNPGSNAGTLTINLNIATGTQTKTVEAGNPTCRQTGYTGLKCLCDTCNNIDFGGCSVNADCPANGGGPGICGGRRCLGGPEAGQPCGTCIGGANHAASCNTASVCPGGTCMNPRVCNGGANDGASCNNTTACPGGLCGECSGGGSCNRPGEATQPNSCLDDTNTPAVEGCISIGNNEGQCQVGPEDQVCSIQTFRSCTIDADCAPPACPLCVSGQSCISKKRECFTDNGILGNTIQVQGNPDTPCGGVSKPTVGTFFCVAPVGASAVNAAGGLPALGRVRIPGTVLVDP